VEKTVAHVSQKGALGLNPGDSKGKILTRGPYAWGPLGLL